MALEWRRKTSKILPEMWQDVIDHYSGRDDGAYAYHNLDHGRNKDQDELYRILFDVIFDSGLIPGDEVEDRGRTRAYNDDLRSRDGHVYLTLDLWRGDYPEIRVPLEKLDPQYVNSDEDLFITRETFHPDMNEIDQGLGVFDFTKNLYDETGHEDLGSWASEMADVIDTSDWVYDSAMGKKTIAYSGPITPDMVEINPRWLNTAEGEHFLEVLSEALDKTDAVAQVPGQLPIDTLEWKPDPQPVFAHKEAVIKQAAWSDVMQKAKRYKDEGRVNLLRNGINYIVSEVRGDSGTYDTEIQRQDPNSLSISGWNCTCPWGEHAWGRTRKFKKFEGRPCAHVMATLWKSQSTPLDEESDLQRELPPGIPPTGDAPGIPDVSAPPGEMVQSLPSGVDERQMGTIQIPGTFSKAMRQGLDSILLGK